MGCQSSKAVNRVSPVLDSDAALTRSRYSTGESGKEYVTFVSHYKMEAATDGECFVYPRDSSFLKIPPSRLLSFGIFVELLRFVVLPFLTFPPLPPYFISISLSLSLSTQHASYKWSSRKFSDARCSWTRTISKTFRSWRCT